MKRTELNASPAFPLHVCGRCRQPFVVPVSLTCAGVGEGFLVEVRCTNCGWEAVARGDEDDLETLDRELDRATTQIAAAADTLALAATLERIDRFGEALRNDLILPEDF